MSKMIERIEAAYVVTFELLIYGALFAGCVALWILIFRLIAGVL